MPRPCHQTSLSSIAVLVSAAMLSVSVIERRSVAQTTFTDEIRGTPKEYIQSERHKPDPIFRQIFPALRYDTRIPIFLPGVLPSVSTALHPLHASLSSSSADRYSIRLSRIEAPCSRNDSCWIAELSGVPFEVTTVLRQGRPVPLAGGKHGYYLERSCGKDCKQGTLSWLHCDHLYALELKDGTVNMLLEIVNSAIENGPL